MSEDPLPKWVKAAGQEGHLPSAGGNRICQEMLKMQTANITALDRRWGSFQGIPNRVGELFLGLAANKVLDYLFDYLLYPLVIAVYGLIHGGLIMMALSTVASLASIAFYDWSKRDWLGIECIKDFKSGTHNNRFLRFVSRLLHKSDWIAFVVLSLQYDPFITTIYMRKGAFNGMKRRDVFIFVASTIVSNIWWTLACFSGIKAVEYFI